MKLKKTEIAATILTGIIIFGIGFMVGYSSAIDMCIDVGQRVLDIELNSIAVSEIAQRFPEVRFLLG